MAPGTSAKIDRSPEDNNAAVAVGFPLSGEWCALNTPGYKVPSHGTDELGQRYAYDFLQIDWHRAGYRFHTRSALRSLLLGVPLQDTYCWSQPIQAPFDGEVVEAVDGLTERNPAHFIRDLAVMFKHALSDLKQSNRQLHPILGNFIILKKTEGVYALFAHARSGSIRVSEGEHVYAGQPLAEVGHSGNSTAPHLHFQLMDSPELAEARGLPCCFSSYQTYADTQWHPVRNGIPGRRERIRA